MHSPTTPRAASRRILARCDELAGITDERGCITRGFLSPAMEEVNARVGGWMRQAGLQAKRDAVGNLVGTYACGRHDAPLLVLGSHLDTVRDAGRYDGILGVLLALAVIEELGDAGLVSLPFDLEIAAFADEEGLRFGLPFLGSLARIGELEPTLLERCDDADVPLRDAICSRGGDPGDLCCQYSGKRLLGYVEAHIEQGPSLEHQGLALGVLDAIAASCWLNLRFLGQAGHAGTTPMTVRRDAMPAAAEAVLAIERLAEADGEMVATVGKLRPLPGAGNVIAGQVDLSLDLRHPDGERVERAIEELLETCRGIAQRRGLDFEHQELSRQAGAPADPRLSTLLAEAATTSGCETTRLVIGAGHDALILARRMPMAMLLVRCPGGLSHHPDEAVAAEDVAAAHSTLHAFVRRLAELESGR